MYTMTYVNGVSYGNATFVAVGDEVWYTSGLLKRASIWVSADGVTWVRQATGLTGLVRLKGVAFGGGTFVAVGAVEDPGYQVLENVVLTSPDGSNWTKRQTGGS